MPIAGQTQMPYQGNMSLMTPAMQQILLRNAPNGGYGADRAMGPVGQQQPIPPQTMPPTGQPPTVQPHADRMMGPIDQQQQVLPGQLAQQQANNQMSVADMMSQLQGQKSGSDVAQGPAASGADADAWLRTQAQLPGPGQQAAQQQLFQQQYGGGQYSMPTSGYLMPGQNQRFGGVFDFGNAYQNAMQQTQQSMMGQQPTAPPGYGPNKPTVPGAMPATQLPARIGWAGGLGGGGGNPMGHPLLQQLSQAFLQHQQQSPNWQQQAQPPMPTSGGMPTGMHPIRPLYGPTGLMTPTPQHSLPQTMPGAAVGGGYQMPMPINRPTSGPVPPAGGAATNWPTGQGAPGTFGLGNMVNRFVGGK